MAESTSFSYKRPPTTLDEALQIAQLAPARRQGVFAAAREVRNRVFGKRISFSPKVFLPLTTLCRNRCDYCVFRASPGDANDHTMSPDEVLQSLDAAREPGCSEALFCLGDKPEKAFRAYRATLSQWNQDSTAAYLEWAAKEALERGLLPHTNAGILTREDLQRLRAYNPSMGLMLENISPRLCEKGMPHHKAPDKRPAVRMGMLETAGELSIPFTSGILVGIGETLSERVESLWALRQLHETHGHLQEVIIQNFCPKPDTQMASTPQALDAEVQWAVVLARLIMPEDVSIQAPPNLNPETLEGLLDAGLNDLGGISPVTPDFINPERPWPHLRGLYEQMAGWGYELFPRLCVYDHHLSDRTFVPADLAAQCRAVRMRQTAWWKKLLNTPKADSKEEAAQ